MKPEDLQLAIAATESYLRLLNEAQDCRKLFQRARQPMPPPLIALFGVDEDGSQQLSLGISAPDIDSARQASCPPEADETWISLRAKDAWPTTIALALLRQQRHDPIRAKDLVDRVTSILPNVVGGSVYNMLNRLQADGLVTNNGEGWVLLKDAAAGILSDEYLWAPPNRLSKPDLAAHRREAILHLLRTERYLQVMQIVEKLHGWSWVKAPVNKDLLKADMLALEAGGLARRINNSRNWEAI